MVRSNGVFFVVARTAKDTQPGNLELNPLTASDLAKATASFEQAEKDVMLDDGGEEALKVKAPTGPATPSQAEREQHELTHVPYRSWCQHCVAARAADKAHPRSTGEEEGLPKIEFDFGFVGKEEDDACIPLLNMCDVGYGCLSAILTQSKAMTEYITESALHFVESLGHNAALLQSGQEPVLITVLKVVQQKRKKRTLLRHGARGSHQSQGHVEAANRVVHGVVRALWSALETRIRGSIKSDSWSCLISFKRPLLTFSGSKASPVLASKARISSTHAGSA